MQHPLHLPPEADQEHTLPLPLFARGVHFAPLTGQSSLEKIIKIILGISKAHKSTKQGALGTEKHGIDNEKYQSTLNYLNAILKI